MIDGAVFSPVLAKQIEKAGIVAAVSLDRQEDAVPLARALLAGGVSVMELTLRTTAALKALKAIRCEVPELAVGAGTVLRVDQVEAVKEAGALFGVAPGTNVRVLREARDAGLPFAPGVLTQSDVELAVEEGCRLMKFFPSEPSGGVEYLRSMAAPFPHLGVKFIPLGRVHQGNLPGYLEEGCVAAVGGSWLAPEKVVAAGDWQQITAMAREVTEIISRTRRK
jgi:2-dehydro-3-deoxyphosphogluconate aldolase/(4S)-4-hydroxy-2-oxoglutarate aldolase